MAGVEVTEPQRHQRSSSLACGVRFPEFVAATLDKDKLHDVLDQAVIVIDEQDLERSRRDPRVRAFHESADKLMEELEAEGATTTEGQATGGVAGDRPEPAARSPGSRSAGATSRLCPGRTVSTTSTVAPTS